MATTLHTVRVHTGSRLISQATNARASAAVKVNVFDVEGVDVAGQISEDRETDVDKEVCAAARDHEHTDRGHYTRKERRSALVIYSLRVKQERGGCAEGWIWGASTYGGW